MCSCGIGGGVGFEGRSSSCCLLVFVCQLCMRMCRCVPARAYASQSVNPFLVEGGGFGGHRPICHRSQIGIRTHRKRALKAIERETERQRQREVEIYTIRKTIEITVTRILANAGAHGAHRQNGRTNTHFKLNTLRRNTTPVCVACATRLICTVLVETSNQRKKKRIISTHTHRNTHTKKRVTAPVRRKPVPIYIWRVNSIIFSSNEMPLLASSTEPSNKRKTHTQEKKCRSDTINSFIINDSIRKSVSSILYTQLRPTHKLEEIGCRLIIRTSDLQNQKKEGPCGCVSVFVCDYGHHCCRSNENGGHICPIYR